MPRADDVVDAFAMSANGADPREPDLLAELEASQRLLRRVRYDIHDGPLQEVAAFSHELYLVRSELAEADSPTVRAALERTIDELLGRLDDLADELREIALARLPAREALPLEAALMRTVDLFLHSCEIDLSVRLVDEAAMTDSQRIAVTRIVQTALANVAQHSGAARAQVTVADNPDGVAVEIRDDGHGFDVESCLSQSLRDGHLGLVGMLERVELLGGSLQLDSRPGGPTSVRAFLPRAAGLRGVRAPAS